LVGLRLEKRLKHRRPSFLEVAFPLESEKPGLVVGFLAGQEVVWLSEALLILREEAPDVDITVEGQLGGTFRPFEWSIPRKRKAARTDARIWRNGSRSGRASWPCHCAE
jgi:hypothetical protein